MLETLEEITEEVRIQREFLTDAKTIELSQWDSWYGGDDEKSKETYLLEIYETIDCLQKKYNEERKALLEELQAIDTKFETI